MPMIIQLANVLCAVGAIEWGLFAFTGTGIVKFTSSLLGGHHVDTIIYSLVGLSGVISLLAQLKIIS